MKELDKKLQIILETYLINDNEKIVNDTLSFLLELTKKPIITFFTGEFLKDNQDNIFWVLNDNNVATDIINKVAFEIVSLDKFKELSNIIVSLFSINGFIDNSRGRKLKVEQFDQQYFSNFSYLTLMYIRIKAENILLNIIQKNKTIKRIENVNN